MGSGGVAIAALPTVICFKVTFSDGLGGGRQSLKRHSLAGGGTCCRSPLTGSLPISIL